MEQSIKLSEEFIIKSYEADVKGYLKPNVFFHYLEDIAYKHAEKYGFGYSAVYSKGLGWFFLKCHIKFNQLPKAWEKINLTTWAVENKGVLCRRDFFVADENNNKIASIATNWGLVNLESKRLVNPFKTLTFPALYPEYSLTTDFAKIPDFDKISYSKKFDVTFGNIDINQHVNNAVYIDWAINAMPFEFLEKNNVSEIEIYFKKEATINTCILSEVFFDEENNLSLHSIKDAKTGDELTSLRLRWNKA